MVLEKRGDVGQLSHADAFMESPFFKQISNALVAPLCVINDKLQLLFYNQAFAVFFKDKIRNTIGFELHQTTLCQFIGCQSKKCFECGIQECFKSKKSGKISCEMMDRWIEVSGSPVLDGVQSGSHWALCICADITEQKKMEEQIKRSNIALTELLSRLEQERKDAKENVTSSITKMIAPILEKMMAIQSTKDYAVLLKQSIEMACQNLGIHISTHHIHLTSREIELCAYIRTGIPTKDIAKSMGTSVRTVENQRKALRKKLGLHHKADNLVSYLRQAEEKL